MADKEWTIADLAKSIKRTPATTRGLLRKHKIDRGSNKAYVWKNSTAMQAVAKKISSVTAVKKKAKAKKAAAA
jgi:hypothetical protein